MTLKKLRATNNFLLWKRQPVNGRITKVPRGADGLPIGTDAKFRNRLTTYEQAVNAYNGGGYDGVGFVFVQVTERLYICGIDIDHQSADSPIVKDITAMFPNAYVELSPSGDGVHIILLVDITQIPQAPDKNGNPKLDARYYQKNPNNGIECYVAGLTNRYFTHTGEIIQDGKDIDQTAEFLTFLDRYMVRGKEASPQRGEAISAGAFPHSEETGRADHHSPQHGGTIGAHTLTDAQTMEKARKAANGAKFQALFDNGDITGYTSQSNADQALMNMLAFWTRCDAAQMERLFSQSELGKRDKWKNRADYRGFTVQTAIKDCAKVYEPSKGTKGETPNARKQRSNSPQDTGAADNLFSLEPSDFTDVGEAALLQREHGEILKYSTATKFIVYNGAVWEESEIKAQGIQQNLTKRQLAQAISAMKKAYSDLANAKGSQDKLAETEASRALSRAEAYKKFSLSRRSSGSIAASLNEVRPMVEVPVTVLDADGFKLNTPAGTVDLRTGELLPHNPGDYCTKITAVSRSMEGAELWLDTLRLVSCGDKELARYLQLVAGMFAVGKVYEENLIIATGKGKNGKSTFFNTISQVLGTYSGGLSAEIFTTSFKGNKKPELAEMRGKRLIIAAELAEGQRLDTSIVKQLCSTDTIHAEPKYKQPFDYVPTHSTVLYTNHLFKVGTTDFGTWRRLVVVPFNAKIEDSDDKKNYADYLLRNAGGAVLAWIIEGAKRFIANGCSIELPECVKKAIADYREENDWLGHYLAERCELNTNHRQKSGELYADYRSYCTGTGEYIRNNTDFNAALLAAGFTGKRTNAGMVTLGLKLIPSIQPLPPYIRQLPREQDEMPAEWVNQKMA